MSVLVKNMKMPKDCPQCLLSSWSPITSEFLGCFAVPGKRYAVLDDKEYAESSERPDWCPLVEVPTPHGDLIDRQKLLEDNKHLEYPTNEKYRRDRAWAVGFNSGARHCNEHAVYAKTVIEAEGVEE